MDKNSLKILKILIKHKEEINRKNDKELYDLYFNNKYDYEIYQNSIFNLNTKELIRGYFADNILNEISIDDINVEEFLNERKKYYWEKIITPILTGLLMPIIVSIVTALITTYLIVHK